MQFHAILLTSYALVFYTCCDIFVLNFVLYKLHSVEHCTPIVLLIQAQSYVEYFVNDDLSLVSIDQLVFSI